jgi:hypothetical protein
MNCESFGSRLVGFLISSLVLTCPRQEWGKSLPSTRTTEISEHYIQIGATPDRSAFEPTFPDEPWPEISASQDAEKLKFPEFVAFGRRVHPAALEFFLPPACDTVTSVVAIDMVGFLASNKASFDYSFTEGIACYRDPDAHGNGYFQYRYLGATTNRTHILETAVSGGGSGVFMTLMFVRLESDRTIEEGEPRQRALLKLAGTYSLGDRDNGDLTIEGNKVIVGKSKHRESDVVIDVAGSSR